MDIEEINREFRYGTIIKDLKYLDIYDLKNLKKEIKKIKYEKNKQAFFYQFNKIVPNLFNNKIEMVKFTSSFYKGKTCSSIFVYFDRHIYLESRCSYRFYYKDNSDPDSDDDINKSDIDKKKVTFNIRGKIIDVTFTSKESVIKKLKEKYIKNLFDHFSIKSSKNNIKKLDKFIKDTIEIMIFDGELNEKSYINYSNHDYEI
ncbi:hypothetical protein QKC54_gp1026 [Megavirus baoshan]|uniref:Uncharacterized protein n=1 Tax=Megavirus baoshan TaxID=2496520 RepID=A0A3Q8U8G5_9VIRU|nr:hypothetical protein QKC54_gp1026 [Megavirus baoshan]AZL89683.1 hypothetical protein Mb0046 [Megavirus baoshan]